MATKSSRKSASKKEGAKKAAGRAGVRDVSTVVQGKVPMEREQYRSLLLHNPNYFGNLQPAQTVFQPVKVIKSNMTYEQMMCIGYNPQLDQLETVIYIKQNIGYGGPLCSTGTLEHVRFYITYDNGVTWQDLGTEWFTVNDIPGDKPLEYGLTHPIKPKKFFCNVENLPKVRAILSWSVMPPPNQPNYMPVWGNVLDARIQIEPLLVFKVGDLFQQTDTKIPLGLETVLNLQHPVATAPAPALSLSELQVLYKPTNVPEHRYLFPEVQKQTQLPGLSVTAATLALPPQTAVSAPTIAAQTSFQGIHVNIASIIAAIQKTNGNTNFEELTCIGLNNTNDTLLGIIKVKLSNGYSGKLCSKGSQEYVAFWVDWGEGAGLTYVGTTSVNVHDIAAMPADGIQFAVLLPLNTAAHRQTCEAGPKVARVRAILSWEAPPPPANPNYVPTWGNRLETKVLIKPGPKIVPGDSKPYLDSVGGVPVCHINQTTGMATGERPFGGVVTITGFILNPPDVTSPNPLKYKISVRELPGGAWQPLTNTFGISVIEQIGGGFPVSYDITQSIDADGYYTYKEDPNSTGAGWRLVTSRVLGYWITSAPMTGLWEIRIEAKDHFGNTFTAGQVICTEDGTTRQTIKVFLDEVAPTAKLKITGFTRGGGPVIAATDCDTLQKGDIIHGTYESLDEHFGSLSMTIEPPSHVHGAAVDPSSRAFPVVPTTGESGTWTLDTSLMDPCGYVIRLSTADRTLVNSSGTGWTNADFVGFCLSAKK